MIPQWNEGQLLIHCFFTLYDFIIAKVYMYAAEQINKRNIRLGFRLLEFPLCGETDVNGAKPDLSKITLNTL